MDKVQQKKIGKKRRPRLCRPAARGSRAVGTRSGARLNSLRCAPLKQTPHLFPLRAPTTRRYTDGDPDGNCNDNCNGNCNCNCNCNCNGYAPAHPAALSPYFTSPLSL